MYTYPQISWAKHIALTSVLTSAPTRTIAFEKRVRLSLGARGCGADPLELKRIGVPLVVPVAIVVEA